jgi:hypothetical protein
MLECVAGCPIQGRPATPVLYRLARSQRHVLCMFANAKRVGEASSPRDSARTPIAADAYRLARSPRHVLCMFASPRIADRRERLPFGAQSAPCFVWLLSDGLRIFIVALASGIAHKTRRGLRANREGFGQSTAGPRPGVTSGQPAVAGCPYNRGRGPAPPVLHRLARSQRHVLVCSPALGASANHRARRTACETMITASVYRLARIQRHVLCGFCQSGSELSSVP